MEKSLSGRKLLVVGVGNMGEALIRGIVESGFLTPHNIYCTDKLKEKTERLSRELQVHSVLSPSQARDAEIILLAVKPQSMKEALEELKGYFRPQTLFISIAAGISTAFIEEQLGDEVPVIRVMPNLLVKVREGISAISGGKFATSLHREIARRIFESVGRAVEVKEELMDAVTGLSGSGPAYVFLFIESLTRAGINMGLDEETAHSLSLHTVYGAAKMIMETGESPSSLREKVTSARGTTLEGLKVLFNNHWDEIILKAVEAAEKRSQELSAGLDKG